MYVKNENVLSNQYRVYREYSYSVSVLGHNFGIVPLLVATHLRRPYQYTSGMKSFFITNMVHLSTAWLIGNVSSGCPV